MGQEIEVAKKDVKLAPFFYPKGAAAEAGNLHAYLRRAIKEATDETLPLKEGLNVDEGVRTIKAMRREMEKNGLLEKGHSFEIRMLGESEGASTAKNLAPYLWAAGI